MPDAAGQPEKQADAVLALTEAWSWLLNRRLEVWNFGQDSAGSFLVSRRGPAALDQGLLWIRAVQRLDIELVPVLEAKARPQFPQGDFQAAALLAMKEIELRVRTMAGLPNSLTGTALMQQAFRPGKGRSGSGATGLHHGRCR